MHELTKRLCAIGIGVGVALIIVELGCQALFAMLIAPGLEKLRSDPLHYYTISSDPCLGYELLPNYSIHKDGRRIRINTDDIRGDTGNYTATKVAILGDSVPFGTGLSQEQTLSVALQHLLGDTVEVLNFGVPGYGLEEISRLLEVRWPQYQPQTVVYLLNLNDFSRRNTIYEGADNGLYRIYRRPFLKTPFFVRKAIYRIMKRGQMSSETWYRWLYEGNIKAGMAEIERMASFARQREVHFAVVLFPPAVAYTEKDFGLRDVFENLSERISASGLPCFAPVDIFAQHVAELQDNTDHLLPKGCKVLAEYLCHEVLPVMQEH